ncbi:MAG: hypothetical protein R3B70_46715 [Polyangiaceae bacterium]
MTGSAFAGATLDGYLADGDIIAEDESDINAPPELLEHVTLYVLEVTTDTSENLMVCDPVHPTWSGSQCTRNYHKNTDVSLYKIIYWDADAQYPTLHWLCDGDRNAVLLRGEWGKGSRLDR